MKLCTIGSGSSGNCHYLEDSYGNILLLDLGLPIKEIKAGIKFRVSNVVGTVASHQHLDHAKSIDDLRKMGIPVFAPFRGDKTAEFRVNIPFTPQFSVKAIPMTDNDGRFTHSNADGTECKCYGFLIEHEEMGKLLYITDTFVIKWRFHDINHVLLGIDYDDGKEYDTSEMRTQHTFTGHLSLSTGKEFVRITAENNPMLQDVILCHLSQENAEADYFIEQISEVANKPVWVARKGMVVDITKKPYME